MVMFNANEISFRSSSSLAYPFLSVQIESFVQLKRILIRKIIRNVDLTTSKSQAMFMWSLTAKSVQTNHKTSSN